MFHHVYRRVLLLLVGMVLIISWAWTALAQSGTDFQGTVLMADPAAGKLAVKKDEGGTRFTFVVTDKTQFIGGGLKSLADIKKGDHVVVNYMVNGTQYLAQKVTATAKK